MNGDPVVSPDYQLSSTGDNYQLYIPEVFDEDAGRFTLTAENPSGKSSCSAVLIVDEDSTSPAKQPIISQVIQPTVVPTAAAAPIQEKPMAPSPKFLEGIQAAPEEVAPVAAKPVVEARQMFEAKAAPEPPKPIVTKPVTPVYQPVPQAPAPPRAKVPAPWEEQQQQPQQQAAPPRPKIPSPWEQAQVAPQQQQQRSPRPKAPSPWEQAQLQKPQEMAPRPRIPSPLQKPVPRSQWEQVQEKPTAPSPKPEVMTPQKRAPSPQIKTQAPRLRTPSPGFQPKPVTFQPAVITAATPAFPAPRGKAFASVQPPSQQYQQVDVKMEVPVPPKFLETLKNIAAEEGTKVTFDGVVTGQCSLKARRTD